MYDNFLFRKSWWDIIKNLPTEQRNEVIDLITQFMFEDIEPQFEELTAVSMAVQFIIRDINADKERYDNIAEKRREAGRKGAAVTNSAKVGKTANAEFAESAENTKVGKSGKVGSIDIDYDKNKNNTLSLSPSAEVEQSEEESEREEKSKIVFSYAVALLSQGRPNAYTEAEQAYDYNNGFGWVKETTRKNGDVVHQHIRDKLAWLQSRTPKNEQLYPPADGQVLAAILQQTGCLSENRGIIDGFRGFRYDNNHSGMVSLLYTPLAACKKLKDAIATNENVNRIVFSELSKQFPDIKQVNFKQY